MEKNHKELKKIARIIKSNYVALKKNNENNLKELDIGSHSIDKWLLSNDGDILLKIEKSRLAISGKSKTNFLYNILDEIIFEAIEFIDDLQIKDNVLKGRLRDLKARLFEEIFIVPDIFGAYPKNKILRFIVLIGLIIHVYIILQYFLSNPYDLSLWETSSSIWDEYIYFYQKYILNPAYNILESVEYLLGRIGYYGFYFLTIVITICLGWLSIICPLLIIISIVPYSLRFFYGYYKLRQLIKNYN